MGAAGTGVLVHNSSCGANRARGALPSRLSSKQELQLAKWIDKKFEKTGEFYGPHKANVYSNKKIKISQDTTGHRGNGAVWKMFDRQGRRTGTYNHDLSRRLGN